MMMMLLMVTMTMMTTIMHGDDDMLIVITSSRTMLMMMTMTRLSLYHIKSLKSLSFYIHFKVDVRADWRYRGCVVLIIIMTVGDAEDAR